MEGLGSFLGGQEATGQALEVPGTFHFRIKMQRKKRGNGVSLTHKHLCFPWNLECGQSRGSEEGPAHAPQGTPGNRGCGQPLSSI